MNIPVHYETEFYKEICNASELSEEKEICLRYDKGFKKVRSAINEAMKTHMMSCSNDIGVFQQMIIIELKVRKL